MSDYTPTTGEVRGAYAKRRALYLASSGRVLANDAKYDREDYIEFDRWLEAHDAAKRAEWEAEQGETEWEYATGAESRDKPGTYWVEDKARDRNQAERWLAEYEEMGTFANALLLLRRRKSPWLPVPDTGAES